VKIMSGLDIADRLRPQDGRARVSIGGRRIDLRVSTLPAATGEKVVIRILDAAGLSLRLDSLGLGRADLVRLQGLVDMREGIILVTGPTGSGKTTTLYAALKAVQARGVNVVTVEDPVEYKLAGIVQVQVNERAGLTFASALRSILRQDPDVVLVGEIRDRETASIAIQASLTGHLVLSTLHTIDASSSVARLLDIGIESYKIGAALKGVVSQRLVRRLCPRCRRPNEDPPPPQVRRSIPPGSPTFRAAGCDDCGNSGYRGRMALVEVLVVDEEVERCISNGEGIERISEAARAAGMRSLWQSGVDHVLAGSTDVDELLRVVEVPATMAERASPLRRTASRSAGVRLPHIAAEALTEDQYAETTATAPSRHHHLAVGERAFDLLDDPAVEAQARRQPCILLALGDRELRATLGHGLGTHGYRVIEAPDGVAALAEADRMAPDAFVLDLLLQGVDASVVLARLRTRLHPPPPPVIVLAPGADEECEVRLLDAGATDVQIRPASVRTLSARLRALVSRPVRA
jgi:Tfp pilus assembly pilus retraction ATPase PilT/ActR/RegA family two-component response regulator